MCGANFWGSSRSAIEYPGEQYELAQSKSAPPHFAAVQCQNPSFEEGFACVVRVKGGEIERWPEIKWEDRVLLFRQGKERSGSLGQDKKFESFNDFSRTVCSNRRMDVEIADGYTNNAS